MESFPQSIMASSNSTPNLRTMPPEILLNILSLADTFKCKVNLARTCSPFYNTLIDEVYKQASESKSLAQAHIYEACRDGNILTLERAFRSDAYHINNRIQGQFDRPLYTAVKYYQVDVVRWLLQHGADPNFADKHDAKVRAPFDFPLQIAVLSVLEPGNPRWHIPKKWRKKGFVMLTRDSWLCAGRAIIKLLRDAGADENALTMDEDREHLDSIQANAYCCREHPVTRGVPRQ